MKKYLLLSVLTFLELISYLIIYSIIEASLLEIGINWVEFTTKTTSFSFLNLIATSIYWFINCIFKETSKFFILNYLLIFFYNLLLLKNVIENKIIITIAFFIIAFLFFSFIFDANFYSSHNISRTINTILSIIITSFYISKISERIIKLIKKP